MKQVISLHVGGGGIQVANACWELFCLDHGICFDGQLQPNYHQENKQMFFEQVPSPAGLSRYVPRSLHLDLEPTAIDQVKNGPYRNLFKSQQMVSMNENSVCSFSRGYKNVGNEAVDVGMQRIRHLVERCSNFSGFMLYHSISGGTGSGVGSLLYEKLSEQYNKKVQFGLNIFPQQKKQLSNIQPYNSILTIDKLLNKMSIGLVLDNEAMRGICQEKFKMDTCSYADYNRLCAQMVCYMTSCMRFERGGYVDLSQYQSQLTVYQRFKFMMGNFSPMAPRDYFDVQPTHTALTTIQCFKSAHRLVKCEPKYGKYISCGVLYRGDIIPKDVTFSTIKCDKNIQFVDWSPGGMRASLCYHPINVSKSDIFKPVRSACLIANTTAISQVFGRLALKYDLMYSKRAFVHWYVSEGMEEMEFTDARENLAALQVDYEEAGIQSQYQGQQQ